MGKTMSNLVFLALLSRSCFRSQFVTATTLNIIKPFKFIKDPEFIISQGGVFRLGFFGFPNSTNRYVGIWYNHIPQQTVVWVANGNNPLRDSSGVMKMSEDGNLVVLNGQEEIMWTSNVSNPVSNTSAQLLDSGNLVLDKNGFLSIWESFQHPSNAHLPYMKITSNIRTGQKVKIRSWKSPVDPSDGNFTGFLEPLDIPELVISNKDQLYYRRGPCNGRIFNGILMTSYYHDGFSVVADDKEETYSAFYAFSNKSLVVYYELSSQGTIIQRIWNVGKGMWDEEASSLRTACDSYGKCGAFGVCDPMKPSICCCLKGFEPKNREEWSKENWTGGCVRTTSLQCQKVMNGVK